MYKMLIGVNTEIIEKQMNAAERDGFEIRNVFSHRDTSPQGFAIFYALAFKPNDAGETVALDPALESTPSSLEPNAGEQTVALQPAIQPTVKKRGRKPGTWRKQ